MREPLAGYNPGICGAGSKKMECWQQDEADPLDAVDHPQLLARLVEHGHEMVLRFEDLASLKALEQLARTQHGYSCWEGGKVPPECLPRMPDDVILRREPNQWITLSLR